MSVPENMFLIAGVFAVADAVSTTADKHIQMEFPILNGDASYSSNIQFYVWERVPYPFPLIHSDHLKKIQDHDIALAPFKKNNQDTQICFESPKTVLSARETKGFLIVQQNSSQILHFQTKTSHSVDLTHMLHEWCT